MSRPVGSTSSNALEVNFGEVEGERSDSPSVKVSPPSSSKVEPWSGGAPQGAPCTPSGPSVSGQELAAQSVREAAERRTALTALGNLQGPISKLAAKHPDPIGFFGNVTLRGNEVGFALGDTLHDPQFSSAAAKLSAADVRSAVAEQVKKAWPQCTPKEAEQLKQYFMGQVAESLREGAAPRLQKLATKMLDDAGKAFEKTAADPAAVKALAQRLTDMADPLAEIEDQLAVKDLRASFGLDPEKVNVSPEELTRGLHERAALLKDEARKMQYHDRLTVFRALAEQDVGPLFKQAAGVREDSFLAAQIDGVKAVGQSEAQTIKTVKLWSAVAATLFTGGLGGVGMSMGVSLSMASPSVLQAWQQVDTAKAGESAGTMKAGAAEEAHRNAVIATGEAAVVAVTAAGAEHALHHVAETLAAPAVVHMADQIVKNVFNAGIELGVETIAGAGTHALEESLADEGHASGQNALQRASR